MNQDFNINGHNISVRVDAKGNGSITSDLRTEIPNDEHDIAWNFGVDVFESFILALACAEYDLDSKKMDKVLITVMDAMLNHIDEIDLGGINR
jgi:hypothetical protein